MTTAFVGLGANLGDRERAIRGAAELLEARRLSTIRETEPWGLTDQPRFLNAVAELETDRTPRELLDRLLEVERELGRVREGPRWGPRVIDLDLLLYGDRRIDEPGLEVRTRGCRNGCSCSSRSPSSHRTHPSRAAGRWRNCWQS